MNTKTELDKIRQRNERVEADKAWETSKFRIGSLFVFTYVVAALFMVVAGFEEAWLAAFVPAIGYLLSTLGLPGLKRWWVKRFYDVNE
jgi:hypothetical protein